MEEAEEIQRLNVINIDLPPQRPRRERDHNQIQVEQLRARLRAKDKEMSDYKKRMDLKMDQINQRMTNMANTNAQLVEECARLMERMKISLDSAPKTQPILTRNEVKRERQPSNSSFGSKASSRAPSPEFRNGMLPLFQDVVYGTKMLLKQKEEKFPEALQAVRKHIDGPESVYNRMKIDEERAKSDFKTSLAEMLPHLMDLAPMDNLDEYAFVALPENLGNDTYAREARRDLQRSFKVSNDGPYIREVIFTVISRYNGKLTEKQFKDVVLGVCVGPYIDTISNVFRNNDLNKAIKYIVRLHGCLPSSVDKITNFTKLKVDQKNPTESMKKIMCAAVDCFNDETMETTTVKAIQQCLTHLPENVVRTVVQKMVAIEKARENNPRIQPLDFFAFMDLVLSNLN